jgi:hypothetical protein
VSLESELRALEVEWPETPELALRLRPRRPRRRWVWPAALLVGLVAVSPARSAVLDVLGITGGAKIVRVAEPPDVTRGPLDLGRETSLREARRGLAFRPKLPTALGEPQRVRYSARIAGGALTLDWPGFSLTQFQGGSTPFVKKLLDDRSRVRDVRVGSALGFYISGPAHYVVLDRKGDAVDAAAALVEADVLLWDTPDGLSFRLETRRGQDEALAVARTLR